MTGNETTGKYNLFECSIPILSVRDLSASIDYYVNILGFQKDWADQSMASVSRDRAAVYLCQGEQGQPGTWIWIGVNDVQSLFEEYKSKGALIRMEPVNFSWAYEMRIEDPDGHVLRIGSEPKENEPYSDQNG